MNRGRLRKFILITGTTLCVLIAAAFVLSTWWWIRFAAPGSRNSVLDVMAGSVKITNYETTEPRPFWVKTRPHRYGLSSWNAWEARRFSIRTGHTRRFSIRRETRGLVRTRRGIVFLTLLQFPIYAVFLAALLPTLAVWRFGRKPVKPGHCRCGYDLTGNTSGGCPECGIEVRA